MSTASVAAPRRVSLPVIDHKPAPYDGPSREEVLALRKEYLSPAILTYYRQPVNIVEGYMQYLYDDAGKRYLDGFAGIVSVSVGHSHPKVVARVCEQTARLGHTTTIYLHPTIGQYAKKLAEHMPKGSNLKTSYFTNSGSEANDLAIMTCRVFTGRFDVIALRNGYHGGSQTTMGLTSHHTWKYTLPHGFGVKHAMPGYCYRCPLGLTYPSCDVRCAQDVEELIKYDTSGEVAAFIGEPIQGVGGTVTPPPEYFKIVYEIVRKHGGLCIADEVQTGWGRTGAKFWGFENYDVIPDMVVMAKGIANGAPVGAMTTRPEIAAPMAGRLHFNTFGGNPVSMAQAMATLEVMDEENIQAKALAAGKRLKDNLLALQDEHPLIGEVRGMGLMLGVELVEDRESKAPAKQAAADLVEWCKDRGLLLGKGGLYGNVIRIKPPMCITNDDVDFMTGCMDEALGMIEDRGK